MDLSFRYRFVLMHFLENDSFQQGAIGGVGTTSFGRKDRRRRYPATRTRTAESSGQGATNSREEAKLVCPVTSLPTIMGPAEPPKFPIILMKPIAEAAAVAPRNMVGIGQKAGRCAYMNGPFNRKSTSRGQIH